MEPWKFRKAMTRNVAEAETPEALERRVKAFRANLVTQRMNGELSALQMEQYMEALDTVAEKKREVFAMARKLAGDAGQ